MMTDCETLRVENERLLRLAKHNAQALATVARANAETAQRFTEVAAQLERLLAEKVEEDQHA